MSSYNENNMAKLNSVCRICLQEQAEMRNIYDKYSTSDSRCILEIIIYCTSIKHFQTDKSPSNICFICEEELNISVKFKEKCLEAEKFLQDGIKVASCDILVDKHLMKSEAFDCVDPFVLSDHNLSDNSCFDGDTIVENPENIGLNNEYSKGDLRKRKNAYFSSINNCNDGISIKSSNCNKARTPKSIEAKSITNRGSNKSVFQCETCNTECRSKTNLKIHMKTHSGERPFQCDICLKCFITNSNMRWHKRNKHDQDIQVCSECGKSFSCTASLKRHLITHLDVKPHACTYCSKTFVKKFSLQEHIARHLGIRRYFCEVCSSKFSSNVNLKQHMLVHQTEEKRENLKKHQCSLCEYRTIGRHDLLRHMTKHTGEKPYKCSQDNCNAAYATRYSLKCHSKTHTGEKPFECTVCPAKYIRSDKYKSHMFKKHNISASIPHRRSKLIIEELVDAKTDELRIGLQKLSNTQMQHG